MNKNAKCKNNHSSLISISAGCDLNTKGNLLKVHKFCPNPKCKCQKQITLTANQFRLEGSGFKSTNNEISKGSPKAWDSFLNSAVNTLATDIGMTVGAKSKKPQVGPAMVFF